MASVASPSPTDVALDYAASQLKFADLKTSQRDALENFMLGKDVFVSLPTGYGKSLIYQAAPFCMDSMKKTDDSMAIVISPLVSLMRDQQAALQRRGISSCYMGDNDKDGNMGNILTSKIILASPETMIGERGRSLLLKNRHRICGIFVDESHCVAMW